MEVGFGRGRRGELAQVRGEAGITGAVEHLQGLQLDGHGGGRGRGSGRAMAQLWRMQSVAMAMAMALRALGFRSARE